MKFRLFLLLLLHTCSLFGQNPGKSQLLSVNDGLSQGMVFDILQSRDGFLWIATKDGLNRYDGYRFEIFSHDPFDPFSIASNEVWKLFEDSRGRIWAACPAGLDVFLPETGRFFHILPELPGFNGDFVSFAETPGDVIWITASGKFWKVNALPDMLEKAAAAGNAFPGLPCKAIELPGVLFSTILYTRNGILLAGATKGLYRVNPENGALQQEALPGTPVKVIGEDNCSRVWLTAISPELQGLFLQPKCGLWLWEDNGQAPRQIPCLPFGRYRFDPDGFLWAWKTADNIFRKWEPKEFEKGGKPELEWDNKAPFTKNPHYFPTTIAFDGSGLAWLGTNGFGVLKVNFEKPKFTSYLPFTSQRMIVEDPQGNLFTHSNRYTLYSSARFSQGAPNPWMAAYPKQEKYAMAAFDGQGNCWVNNGIKSLYRIDARDKTAKVFPWQGVGLIACKNGKLLSVSEEGLVQFDPVTEQSRLIPFDEPQQLPAIFNYLHFLYEDSAGTVWIFAFEGLIRAAPEVESYHFSHFNNDPAGRNSLSSNTALCVAEDPLEPNRYLWVGTKGGGLNRLNRKTGKFQHYKTGEGMPDNVVYGILPDDNGHLWLSTNRGLCRFHVREEATRNFTVADGLQSNEFNRSSYLKTKSGRLIFGGVNGLTVFHPDSLQFNDRKPNTAITRIWVNNNLVGFRPREGAEGNFPVREKVDSQTTHMELAHHQNLISLEFAALEFSNPAQNQYRYQLLRKRTFGESDEQKWVELGYQNSVQFANLQPGRYTFKVLGGNNDGAWSERPAALEFVIRHPWWAAWWTYLLYALAVGVVVLIGYRYQLRQRLQAQEALRLRELDEFKNRFFTNITHEFRTPLTVILGEADKLQREGQAPEQSAALIKRSGENLLRLINQLLDLAKLESNTLRVNYAQGDVLAYLRYICEGLQPLAKTRGVMLKVESEAPEIIMDYDPERLQQIVHNLLSNAIKFTPPGGKVELQAEVSPQPRSSHLILTVSDTGVGIPPEELPRIFDRFYSSPLGEPVPAIRREGWEGAGIGLALTKDLVAAMGGEIDVESELGKGTVFTVRLPVSKQAERMETISPDPQTKPESKDETPEAAPPDAATVLIIEDHPDVVEYLASRLSSPSFGGRRGGAFALHLAYNGREGIEKALETVPDLIVSDVMMPEKDGFEVCEMLKNDERTSHIPIVLLTAKAGVEHRIAGLRRGADAYLAKPFHEEELLATLDNLLEGRKKLREKYRDAALRAPTAALLEEPDPEAEFLQKARAVVLNHLSDATFSVDGLCRALAMSQPQLHRKLTALTGRNATLFIRSIRLAIARELLLAGGKNVSEVAYTVGFSDPKYFSRVFTKEFGLPPSKI